MYLFLYRYTSDNVSKKVNDYEIVTGYNLHAAIANFYDSFSNGKLANVDKAMFERMITAVGDEEAIEMHNALCKYKIEKIYKNLEEVYHSVEGEKDNVCT